MDDHGQEDEMEPIEYTREVIQRSLAELQSLFIRGMKLSFVARYPGHPDIEMVITDDNLDEVMEVLRRSKIREFPN